MSEERIEQVVEWVGKRMADCADLDLCCYVARNRVRALGGSEEDQRQVVLRFLARFGPKLETEEDADNV